MFCDCVNDAKETHPNVNVCPICMGHPGTLPAPNTQAIESVLRLGMVLGGDIPAVSKFDRKNYFYPDLPKGYQISQYDRPLIAGGLLCGVRIRRIHLEEDTGRLIHNEPDSGSSPGRRASLVDFNRAGVPLMELVTEPDIANADDAVKFAKELQLIVRYLGVSDADMEKGQLRVEANVSIRPNSDRFVADSTAFDKNSGDTSLGTKVELKNINSFKALHDAIEYEIKRQAETLERGEKVRHETRGWDDAKRATVSQRHKEEAHDYRYFPEPDIPPLDMSKFDLTALRKGIPEMPAAKRSRFAREYGLEPEVTELLIVDRGSAEFFEEAVSELKTEDNKNLATEIRLIANYLNADLRGLMTEEGIGFDELKLTPENFADLIELISHGKLTSRGAKDILAKMVETGEDPNTILEREGLHQVSDEAALLPLVEKIVLENPQALADYRKGKANALEFLVGQAMKELRGKGNPEILRKLFRERVS